MDSIITESPLLLFVGKLKPPKDLDRKLQICFLFPEHDVFSFVKEKKSNDF